MCYVQCVAFDGRNKFKFATLTLKLVILSLIMTFAAAVFVHPIFLQEVYMAWEWICRPAGFILHHEKANRSICHSLWYCLLGSKYKFHGNSYIMLMWIKWKNWTISECFISAVSSIQTLRRYCSSYDRVIIITWSTLFIFSWNRNLQMTLRNTSILPLTTNSRNNWCSLIGVALRAVLYKFFAAIH
jgi:hypothetical protein